MFIKYLFGIYLSGRVAQGFLPTPNICRLRFLLISKAVVLMAGNQDVKIVLCGYQRWSLTFRKGTEFTNSMAKNSYFIYFCFI
jgi:hypothetical protein